MSAADDSAEAILRALTCGQPRCPCTRAERRGHGLTHCPCHADATPSFNVSVRNQTLLAFCHGSCSQESVIDALRSRGLWPEHEDQARYGGKIELDCYQYHDEHNQLLYEVIRYFPKGFSQRRRSGNRTVWNLDGVERKLYRLPELLAADPHRTRFVVEGEKDVNRLWAMDVVATCNPGGAGKWRDEFARVFADQRVVVVPDNDDVGRDHARDVCRSLAGIAARVYWLELPGLDDHEDLSDWLDNGGTREQLQELARAAPPPEVEARRGPELTQTVDEILYRWPDQGLTCTFSRLRETDSGMIRGFIEVQSSRPDSHGLVTWQGVTLSNATDRDRISKKLIKASPRDEDLWAHDVEVAFQEVQRAFSTVPPPVELADVTEAAGSGYLFRPIVPLGQVCEFLADQGTTKSYLLLYLLVCTVLGHESIFGAPSRVGPAILFDWETDTQTVRRRLGWILRGMGLSEPPRGLHYVCMSDRGKLIDRARDMRHQIVSTGAVLVAIDSLTFATGGDLNQTELSAPTMSAIGGLGESVSKIVATHPSKAVRQGNGATASAVGSGLFEFRARGIWFLQRPREYTPSFVVSMSQHKLSDDAQHPPIFYRVSFDRNRQAVSFSQAEGEEEPELYEATVSVRQRIVGYLRRQPAHQANVSQIARAINERPDTVRKTCNRMSTELTRLSGDESSSVAVWSLRDAALNGVPSVEDVRDTVPGQAVTVPGHPGDDLPW